MDRAKTVLKTFFTLWRHIRRHLEMTSHPVAIFDDVYPVANFTDLTSGVHLGWSHILSPFFFGMAQYPVRHLGWWHRASLSPNWVIHCSRTCARLISNALFDTAFIVFLCSVWWEWRSMSSSKIADRILRHTKKATGYEVIQDGYRMWGQWRWRPDIRHQRWPPDVMSFQDGDRMWRHRVKKSWKVH